MNLFLWVAFLAILTPLSVLARPVSYPGGITLMQMNDKDASSIHVHYSPTAKYSIGYKGEYWRDQNWQFHGLQLNNLFRRWNKPASQANVYLKSGVGIVRNDGGEDLAAFAGISMDWEDRRFFTAYENRFFEPGDVDSFFSQKARIGMAPYIGGYGDLHTWLMLQVEHSSADDGSTTVTPLIRFFKNEYLAEIGVTEDGDALFNMIIRY